MKNFLVSILVLGAFFISSQVFASDICLDLKKDLAIGSEDIHYNTPDVTKLQNYLFDKGLLTATPNGYFGFGTQAAARSFQLMNGLEVTGFVGPITRGKIKELTCGQVTPPVLQATSSPTSVVNNTSSSISDFINLLISIGIIAPDKISAVNAFLSSSALNPIVPINPSPSTITIPTPSLVNSSTSNPVVSSGGGGGGGIIHRYSVIYNGNGNIEGEIPEDSNDYRKNSNAVVLGAILRKDGYDSWYWNTQADGSGTDYLSGNTIVVSSDIILYAKWVPVYSVTYNGNGFNGGSVASSSDLYQEGTEVTVLGNTGVMTKTGFTFDGWNTQTNGSGTHYSAADIFSMPTGGIVLYAQWSANNNVITFDANTGTGSMATQTIATDATSTLTLNSFTKASSTFAGWATSTDGAVAYTDGTVYTMGTSNVTLYAIWAQPSITVVLPTGGENLEEGTVFDINWNTYDLSATQNLDISIFLDSRGVGKEIATSVPNTGSYLWTVKSVQPFYASEMSTWVYPNGQYRIIVACPYNDYSICRYNHNFGESNIFSIASSTIITSLASTSPIAQTVVANNGAGNNETDNLTTLVMDFKAINSDINITNIIATTTGTAVGADIISSAYLYNESTLIGVSSSTNGIFTFANLSVDITKNSTSTLFIKVDIRNASSTPLSIITSVDGPTGITAQNSVGDTVTVNSGSATGNTINVVSSSGQFTVVSKSLGTKNTSDDGFGNSTSTQDYNFKIRIDAIGGDVEVGSSASTTPGFGIATSTYVNVYKGVTLQDIPSVSVSYFEPSSGVTSSNNTYTIAEGDSADFDVVYTLTVSTANVGSYSVGIKGIMTDGALISFMDGLAAWRSSSVVLP